MKDVNLYRRGRKYTCDSVAAKLPGTQAVLARTAVELGGIANGLLSDHVRRTRYRHHDLPSPTISVERKYDQDFGRVDYFVSLEAYDRTERLALGRAIGIEFGHEYETYDQSPSGPWGRSEGLNILGRAVDLIAAFGV